MNIIVRNKQRKEINNRYKLPFTGTEYMFTRENIEKLYIDFSNSRTTKKKTKTTEKKNAKQIKRQMLSDYFTPEYDLKLLWCWIIFFYGMSEYEITQNRNWERESVEKIKMIEELRKHKKLLKSIRQKRNKLEGDLNSAADISVDSIITMCAIHKYNLIYIKNEMYYMYENDAPVNTLIIRETNSEPSLYIGSETDNFMVNIENLWRIYDMKKPLKALTVYKLKELQDICKKLKLDILDTNGKKKTKKVLYQSILSRI